MSSWAVSSSGCILCHKCCRSSPLLSVSERLGAAETEVVAKFALTKNNQCLKDPAECFLTLVHGGLLIVLSPILLDSTTPASLAAWFLGYRTRLDKARSCCELVNDHKDALADGEVHTSVLRLSDIANWLSIAQEVNAASSPNTEQVQHLLGSIGDIFRFEVPNSTCVPAKLLESPLLAGEGSFMKRLFEIGTKSLGDRLKVLIKLWHDLLHPSGESTKAVKVGIGGMSMSRLDSLSKSSVDDALYIEANKHARLHGDLKLVQHLGFLHVLHKLIVTLASFGNCAKSIFLPNTPWADKKISEKSVEKVLAVRDAYTSFRQLVDRPTRSEGASQFHVSTFAEMMDMKAVAADVESTFKEIHNTFSQQYTKDMAELEAALKKCVPESFPEDKIGILENDVLCQELVKNTQGYQRAGKLVDEVGLASKLLKKVLG